MARATRVRRTISNSLIITPTLWLLCYFADSIDQSTTTIPINETPHALIAPLISSTIHVVIPLHATIIIIFHLLITTPQFTSVSTHSVAAQHNIPTIYRLR